MIEEKAQGAGSGTQHPPAAATAEPAASSNGESPVEGSSRSLRSPSPKVDEAEGARMAAEIDRISLAQALLDAEVANLRAIDLTKRLMESAQDNTALKRRVESLEDELSTVRSQYRALQANHKELVSTKAFKLMKVIWAIRKAINV